MQQSYFLDKNVLYLFPTDENLYLNFIYDELRKYIGNIYRLDVVKYSHMSGIRNTEKYIEKFIADKKIDVVISSPFATDYQLSVQFYASLKKRAKIVFWMWDDEAYFDSYSKYYCQTADAVITCDYFSVFAYKKLCLPAIFFPPTHSKNTYYPVDTVKDIDVCFIGGCNQSDRREYINFLIKNGVNIETFGTDSKNGFLAKSEFPKVLSRSKIVLNFNKIDKLNWINKDEPLLKTVRQGGGHYCESALAKSFCLAEYTPSINIIAEVGREIDIFHDKEELLEKIRYYLSNNSKREETAGNAYGRVSRDFVPEVTIPKTLSELEKILEKTEKRKPVKHGPFLSRAFKIKTVNGLTFTMFVLIKNLKIKYALELFGELFKYGILIFFAGFYCGTIRAIKNMLNKLWKK